MLLLAHREPPPARAEARSRQAACLRLPLPSLSPESHPGALAPRRFSGWGSSRLLSGFAPSSQPGLPAPSLVFLGWVPPPSDPFLNRRLPASLRPVPAPQSLSSAKSPSLPSSFSFPGVHPILSLSLPSGAVDSPLLFPGLEFQTFWSPPVVRPGSLSPFSSLEC